MNKDIYMWENIDNKPDYTDSIILITETELWINLEDTIPCDIDWNSDNIFFKNKKRYPKNDTLKEYKIDRKVLNKEFSKQKFCTRLKIAKEQMFPKEYTLFLREFPHFLTSKEKIEQIDFLLKFMDKVPRSHWKEIIKMRKYDRPKHFDIKKAKRFLVHYFPWGPEIINCIQNAKWDWGESPEDYKRTQIHDDLLKQKQQDFQWGRSQFRKHR